MRAASSLWRVESANRDGDSQAVRLARDLLDLAITNYAVASESGDDADLNDCSEIAAGIINACNLLSAGSLDEARAAYDGAASTYAGLPPPADPDGLPEGLADIQADILAAFTDSASILATGGTTGDGLGVSTGTDESVTWSWATYNTPSRSLAEPDVIVSFVSAVAA